MKTTNASNFHIPLSQTLHDRLRRIASQQHLPATQVARQAIEYWIEEQESLAVHEQIAEYAVSTAGSKSDIDETLEAAAVSCLLDPEGDR